MDASEYFGVPNTKYLMNESFQANLYMATNAHVFIAQKILKHPQFSSNFDPVTANQKNVRNTFLQ